MLIREYYRTREDGVILWRTYSDDLKKIRQIDTDTLYDEAVDVDSSTHTYEETDIPIKLE